MIQDETIHLKWMREALDFASISLREGEVPVGCVIVYCNRLVSYGYNQTNVTRNGTTHAEFEAIQLITDTFDSLLKTPSSKPSHAENLAEDDSQNYDLETRSFLDTLTQGNKPLQNPRLPPPSLPKILFQYINTARQQTSMNITPHILQPFYSKCTLYVTCEPCIMCAAALSLIGIGSVVYGCKNDRFGGNGSILSLHNAELSPVYPVYQTISGIMAEEAIAIFRQFYSRGNPHAPVPARPLVPIEKGSHIYYHPLDPVEQ
ncbi:putative tRNA-specific adenosine deaminase subunit TAD2 [Blattamonas nauphoetae]|uniref:tRNA-specific adenosine deaminase subunit TAD2 n=1 Tax=Blattamonas nauphoetae TaxID=2049346 RepID=A0ABQ9XL58_9EUKA|nr:putative tRNA-specific adenosine deaminase subunit TAD2 [Blattamonas nauphoetae]